MKEKDQAILVVSFGTSYHESRENAVGAIEQAVKAAFPEYEVRRAFTSQMIINKLKRRDHLVIDNVEEALERALQDGIRTMILQPTHLMSGFEYMNVEASVKQYRDRFDRLVLARPLLDSDEDLQAVMQAVTEETVCYDDGETAVCFMGHGTEAEANTVYTRLQHRMEEAGYQNYFIATVEATPDLEALIWKIREHGTYKKAVLQPLMVVAGDHAKNDMAGEDEGSWKNTFEREGYDVTCVMKGLGEMASVREIYVEHVHAAIRCLTDMPRMIE